MPARALFLSSLLPFLLAAETHQVAAQKYYHTFSHEHPVLQRIKTGDLVVTKTVDSGGKDEKGADRSEGGNPLTGPFYVEGAEPGDAILVRFQKMRLNRNWGTSSYRLGLFSVTPEYVEKIFPPKKVTWEIDLRANQVRLREPASAKVNLEFSVKPMLGCVGVAAPGDSAPTSGPAGSYGGNLDYNAIGEGATVILPVYHPGALLFIGDGHALQGDGEATGNGVETSMDVEFTVEVRKKMKLTGPRVETADDIISVGAQPEFASSLDRALQMATTDMVDWLVTGYGLEPWAAHVLISFQAKYDVVTVAGTMALRIPKAALRK
ncbi:MAG TPA: acetamidase/formamidase family protein [Candidatus Acidoferrales bacterium]|jgi:amidase|nr:acetamidase/formamidase family protein [Candidatus Acidoferrales bacterium]